MRYFIYLSYNGSNYHGWQIQPNAITVQEVVQKALSLIIGRHIDLTGAGRTDTGVHARNMAASKMLEYTDFTSFSKLHTDTRTNNCKVLSAEWEQRGDIWVFTIKADRFLRDMVRATVGTLILVGEYGIDTEDFMRIIEAKDRQKAGQSIDACGLYLSDIEYDKNIFL